MTKVLRGVVHGKIIEVTKGPRHVGRASRGPDCYAFDSNRTAPGGHPVTNIAQKAPRLTARMEARRFRNGSGFVGKE